MARTARFPRSWGPETLRPCREVRRLSREALARLSGVSASAIAKLEHGRHRATHETALRLCGALGLPKPGPGPVLAIPLGDLDPVTAARILRCALKEFAAARHHPESFLGRVAPGESTIDYTLKLCSTLADSESAAALAQALPIEATYD